MLSADMQGLLPRRLAIRNTFASSQTALHTVLNGEGHCRIRASLQDATQGPARLQPSLQRKLSTASETSLAASRQSTVGVVAQPATAQVIDTNLVAEAQSSYLSVR